MFTKKLITILILLLSLVCITFVALTYIQVDKPINTNQEQLITVAPGMAFSTFTKKLVNDGLIDSRFWMRNYVRINPDFAAIKAGTYQIHPRMSQKSLLQLLVSGKEHQFSVTLIEGQTLKQWLLTLEENTDLIQKITDKSYQAISHQLKLNKTNPEGLFYPDTYAFTKGTTDLQILKRAYRRMQKVLQESWLNRDKTIPYKSSYEALIMASIIEKESGKHAEHGLISSVFVNRLNTKMRLQTDPTVIYGLGERYKGDIKRKHLREKTAYNTYRINGLPPTPIAMPSLSALKATMHPLSSEYFYFVSDGEGSHVFSENLTDHNKALKDYLRKTSAK